jgi:hypothetical protein
VSDLETGAASAPRRSIHIGLTRVDPNAYQGWGGWLVAPARDAQAMAELARANGYEPISPRGVDGDPGVFVDEDATFQRLLDALEDARGSFAAAADGTLLLTFSGHGGEATPEGAAHPVDTWVLYDREVSNDEVVNALHLRELAGLSIVVVADCCSRAASFTPDGEVAPGFPEVLTKGRPDWASCVAAPQNVEQLPSLAHLVFLRACQPHQTASDGPIHSLFTQVLLDLAWAGFGATFRDLRDRIDMSLPPWQKPRYDVFTTRGAALQEDPAFPLTARR